MSILNFPAGRRIDLACLGRVAVDLYAQQFGSRLEDARSFQMYLGGSSGNVAFGVARLGLKTAMVSRVGNDQMGVGEVLKLRLADKRAALDSVARHLGMFNDKLDLNVTGPLAERLARARARNG